MTLTIVKLNHQVIVKGNFLRKLLSGHIQPTDCSMWTMPKVVDYLGLMTLKELTEFWACSDESFPFTSVTLELPSLLWWITADDDVVVRTSQPRVLRRYHVRTSHRWNTWGKCLVKEFRNIIASHVQPHEMFTRVFCNSSVSPIFRKVSAIAHMSKHNYIRWNAITNASTFYFDEETLLAVRSLNDP